MKLRFFTLAVCILLLSPSYFSQEKESALKYNAIQAERFAKERTFEERASRGGGGTLQLPFFDDFSRYSLPTNDPSIPVEWQRWADNAVFINSTFPISPMTIGVATFDGMASDGTPYKDTLYFPEINDVPLRWGLSDSLTSLPIDLDGYTAEDSVFLYFNFECGGRGNQPDADGILGAVGDSLILEFYSPLQSGQWFRAWAVEGGLQVNTFDSVFIHIQDPIYLQNGFRFRFKNYGTLHGALDHWHLDYVIIDSDFQVSAFNDELDEVAMQYPINTLLNFEYTSMPWNHFLNNPNLYMSDSLRYFERNLGPVDENIPTRWSISYNGTQLTESASDVNGTGNFRREIDRTMWLENFLYEAPGVEDSASFEVCTYFNQTDANLQNDTTCFTQVFSNYYAYDDGTAERAYGLENAGGKVAMKFATELTDSLLGVYFYFMPIQYLATDQSFILQAWSDAGGQPGTLLTDDLDNFNFSAPRYYANGPNLFVYYEFLKPIEVDQGDFYVGYVQQSDVSLNMGLDKNTSANTTNLFYQLQGSSTWNNSSVQGSVMMRPVFKAALPDWVGIEENAVVTTEIYPNPAANQISFSMKPDFEQYQIRITDLTGRIVKDETIVNSGIVLLDIESLVSSSYLLQITCLADQRTAVKQFIKE